MEVLEGEVWTSDNGRFLVAYKIGEDLSTFTDFKLDENKVTKVNYYSLQVLPKKHFEKLKKKYQTSNIKEIMLDFLNTLSSLKM